MERVLIFDTTLRDGEQSPGMTMTPEEKLRLAHQLDCLGVDVIEAGFPVSSPDDFAGVSAIAREVSRPVIAALARARDEDIDCAAKALEHAQRPRLHVFIATSDLHLERKLCISREQCVERAVAAVERARHWVDDVEFSAEDATRTDPAFLCRVVQAAVDAGAGTINIPDTVGYTYPSEYGALFRTLRAKVRGIERTVLSAHCHDDLGLAVANSLAAVEAGARQVECTVNGIGERAGNAALEEIVMALHRRRDLLPYGTAVDTAQICPSSQLLSQIVGCVPAPNKAIVGRNAFAHEAGIHQDGVIKDRSTYEILAPDEVGASAVPGLVLGRHSGRSALEWHLRRLGYELRQDELDRVYQRFKRESWSRDRVLDEDLLRLLHGELWEQAPSQHRVEQLEVVTGLNGARAQVRLAGPFASGRMAVAHAGGATAAVAAAVARAASVEFRIDRMGVAASHGGDADVNMQAAVNNRLFTARARAADAVLAAANAAARVLDKFAHARALEARALEAASDVWGV